MAVRTFPPQRPLLGMGSTGLGLGLGLGTTTTTSPVAPTRDNSNGVLVLSPPPNIAMYHNNNNTNNNTMNRDKKKRATANLMGTSPEPRDPDSALKMICAAMNSPKMGIKHAKVKSNNNKDNSRNLHNCVSGSDVQSWFKSQVEKNTTNDLISEFCQLLCDWNLLFSVDHITNPDTETPLVFQSKKTVYYQLCPIYMNESIVAKYLIKAFDVLSTCAHMTIQRREKERILTSSPNTRTILLHNNNNNSNSAESLVIVNNNRRDPFLPVAPFKGALSEPLLDHHKQLLRELNDNPKKPLQSNTITTASLNRLMNNNNNYNYNNNSNNNSGLDQVSLKLMPPSSSVPGVTTPHPGRQPQHNTMGRSQGSGWVGSNSNPNSNTNTPNTSDNRNVNINTPPNNSTSSQIAVPGNVNGTLRTKTAPSQPLGYSQPMIPTRRAELPVLNTTFLNKTTQTAPIAAPTIVSPRSMAANIGASSAIHSRVMLFEGRGSPNSHNVTPPAIVPRNKPVTSEEYSYSSAPSNPPPNIPRSNNNQSNITVEKRVLPPVPAKPNSLNKILPPTNAPPPPPTPDNTISPPMEPPPLPPITEPLPPAPIYDDSIVDNCNYNSNKQDTSTDESDDSGEEDNGVIVPISPRTLSQLGLNTSGDTKSSSNGMEEEEPDQDGTSDDEHSTRSRSDTFDGDGTVLELPMDDIVNLTNSVDLRGSLSWADNGESVRKIWKKGFQLPKALVLNDFEAEEDDEIKLKKGEVIEIHNMDEDTDGWWTGLSSEGFGLFPSKYVKILTTTEEKERDKRKERETDIEDGEGGLENDEVTALLEEWKTMMSSGTKVDGKVKAWGEEVCRLLKNMDRMKRY